MSNISQIVQSILYAPSFSLEHAQDRAAQDEAKYHDAVEAQTFNGPGEQ